MWALRSFVYLRTRLFSYFFFFMYFFKDIDECKDLIRPPPLSVFVSHFFFVVFATIIRP